MRNPSAQSQKGYACRQAGFTTILVVLVLVAIAGVAYLGRRSFTTKTTPSLNIHQQTPQKAPGQKSAATSPQPRSKAPNVITQVTTARGLDIKTGEAVNPASQFSKTDKAIYVVLTLKNPKVGTKFEYTRYLNGKFLGNGNLTMKKTNTNNVSFNWTLKKPGATHLVGNYRVKVYTNGVFEKEVSYQIR